jgi:hypothetical protein
MKRLALAAVAVLVVLYVGMNMMLIGFVPLLYRTRTGALL